MEYKIARIPTLIVFLILIALIVISTCILLFTSKSTKAETESSRTELYELYTLDNFTDGKPRLTLYGNYKVKSEDIDAYSGNVNVIYNATDSIQIIFTDNGVTIVSPKGHKESFTQGYIRRNRR